MRFNKNLRSILLIFLLFNSLNALGCAVSITPLSHIPNIILAGHEAAGIYKLTNNSQGPIGLQNYTNLSSGFSLLSGTESTTGLPFCQTQQLLYGNKSCALGIVTPGVTTGTIIQGIIKYCDINQTYDCVVDPSTVYTVADKDVQPDMPSLSIPTTDIPLPPAIPQYITVTNNSATTIANYVKLIPGSALAPYIESIQNCPYIAPSGTCNIRILIKSGATTGSTEYPFSIQGSNTHKISGKITIRKPGLINTPDVTFTQPEQKTLTLTNTGYFSASVTGISFANGTNNIHNVTIGAIPPTCTNIAGEGGTCQVPLTAATDAYGNDQLNINYSTIGGDKVANAQVNIVNTEVTFTQSDDSSLLDEEFKLHSGLIFFKARNTGNFTWHNPHISWSGTAIPLVTLLPVLTKNCNTSSTILPNDYCSFTVETHGDAIPGSNAPIKATGTNLTDVIRTAVVEGFAIIPEIDPAHLHLGYKAIKIENLTNHQARLTNIVINENLDGVEYCAPNDPNCAYDTDTNCVANGVISAGNSCRMWFKAKLVPGDPVGVTNGTIDITAHAEWNPPSTDLSYQTRSFDTDFEQALYAGGDFDNAGGVPASNIAKWDGTNWSAVGAGVEANFNVLSIAEHYGDLYAGGSFNTAGGSVANKVAEWNGSFWQPLGTPPNDGVTSGSSVLSLVSKQNRLYVGGAFSSASNVPNTNNIAAWSVLGNNWTELSGGVNNTVRTLAFWNNAVYAAGDFNTAGAVDPANKIAWWDGSIWRTLGTGMNSRVNAILGIGSWLYAGGEFTIAGGVSEKGVAAWNGTSWHTMGGGITKGGSAATAYSLGMWNGQLYVGGNFDKGGATSANNIALWTGSSWVALGSGTSNGILSAPVFAITSQHNLLYAAGSFNTVGGVTAHDIAAWNGSSWSPLGSGFDADPNYYVSSLAVIPSLTLTAINPTPPSKTKK